MSKSKKKPSLVSAVLDPNTNKLTIKWADYIRNLGDGSCAAYQFRTAHDADEAAKNDDERYCDDVQERTLILDMSTMLIEDRKADFVDDESE